MDESFVETHLDPDHELPSPTASQMVHEKPRHSFLLLGILVAVIIFISMAVAYVIGTNAGKQQIAVVPSVEPIAVLPSPVIATPAPVDPTADWKMVTNQYWSFKVPANLNYIECNSHDQILVGSPTNVVGSLFDKDKVIECNFDQAGELLSIYRGLDNSQNTVVIPTNTDPKLDPVVSDVQTITVGGITTVLQKETTSFGQGTGTRYKVYVHQTGFTDVVTFNDIAQKSLFDQILSTFKFTSAQADATANWKAYQGEKYTFKYPNDWFVRQSVGGEGQCAGPQFLSPTQKTWLNICPVDNALGLKGVKSNLSTTNSDIKEFFISNHAALEAKYVSNAVGSQQSYNAYAENTSQRDLLWFSLTVNDSEKELYKNTFDQILSTFTFTN